MSGPYIKLKKNPYKSVHQIYKIRTKPYIYIKYPKICMMSHKHANIIMFIGKKFLYKIHK